MCFDLLRLRGLGYSSADFWLDASSGCYRAGGAGAVGGTGSGVGRGSVARWPSQHGDADFCCLMVLNSRRAERTEKLNN